VAAADEVPTSCRFGSEPACFVQRGQAAMHRVSWCVTWVGVDPDVAVSTDV
jgi:hypothetical protein